METQVFPEPMFHPFRRVIYSQNLKQRIIARSVLVRLAAGTREAILTKKKWLISLGWSIYRKSELVILLFYYQWK